MNKTILVEITSLIPFMVGAAQEIKSTFDLCILEK